MKDLLRRARLPLPLAALIAALALPPSGTGDEDKDKPAKRERKFALVIGVRAYKPAHLRSLVYSDRDAKALAEFLPQLGYRQVLSMTYEAAGEDAELLPTARNVRDMLKEFLHERRKDDTILVAFLGHSVQFQGDREHYLCPIDADLTDRDALVGLGDVYKELGKCQAGTKILLLDVCRPQPQSAKSSVKLVKVPRPQEVEVPPGLRVLFGCSPGECSHESDYLKHGIFSYFLLEGLRGKAVARSGELSLGGALKYVQDEVPGRAQVDAGAKVRQTPVLLGEKDRLVFQPGLRDGEGFTNSIGMKLVLVPAGKFKMGSPDGEAERDPDEGPVHEVEMARRHYVGAYEVTQAQYKKMTSASPSHFASTGRGADKVKGMDTSSFPVDSVTWMEAKLFCERLSALPAEKAAGRLYRLPTEAEWEHACRAGGRSRPFHFGDDLSSPLANFNGLTPYGAALTGPYLQRTTAVGSYKPNAWGLYDMHGNVREWCSDAYDKDYYARTPARDPEGPHAGNPKVMRGGAWSDIARACRSAYRASDNATARSITCGFRVVCVPAHE